jgi:hypothetical protein
MLKECQEEAVTPYVFPGYEEYGHMVEPRKQMRKVVKASGVSLALHDLRRTFITVVEGLDISVCAIKLFVSHKINGDVTAGYIVRDGERIRGPNQQIIDCLLSVDGLNQLTKIITLHDARIWKHTRSGIA